MKLINKNKIVVLATTMLLTSLITYGQDSYIKNRWNIKAGYARYQTGALRNGVEKLKASNFRIEWNYSIIDYLESGVYIGEFNNKIFLENDGEIYSEERNIISYGLNANLHLLPFFVNSDDLKIDLYLIGRYGLRSMLNPPEDLIGKYFPEYGIGGGLAYYPWRHWGLFTECSYGKYEYNTSLKDIFIVRYGLSSKF